MHTTINLDELHQEEPITTEQASKQEKTLALALIDEPIIEGEVTTVTEPGQKPTPKQRPYYLIVVFTFLACLLFVGVSLLVPLFTPSATVTIIPQQEHLSTTVAIQIPARVIPALTLAESQSVAATGKRHQDAAQAHGTITFYNGSFTSQTIAAGTILTGTDGIQVVTDQPAIIPAGNPPTYGQVTVSAHALAAGPQGNIAARDINMACCATSVLAANGTSFHGGQNERDYLVVTQKDIDEAAASLQTSLEKSEQAALQAQVNLGEGVITQPCSKQLQSNHKAGDEAEQVIVTVSETCEGLSYLAHDLQQQATQLLTQQVTMQVGASYSLMGSIQVSVLRATITDKARGIATIAVKADATYVYQLTHVAKQRMSKLIAGKTKQQAQTTLLQQPGIQGASITVKGNAATLPDDPGRITIIVVYSG